MPNVEDVVKNLQTKILTSGTDSQRTDRFNVRFLGIPENLSDFLSRQVRMVTPPAITFDMLQHSNRRASFQDVGKIETDILSIGIMSDSEGVADGIIMSQIFRQKGMDVSGFDAIGWSNRFDVKIEYMNARGKVVRHETYKNCYISILQKGDLDVETDTNVILNLTLQFDGVEYSIEKENFFLTS